MSVTVVHYLRAVLVCGIAGMFCSYQFMLQGATSVMVPQLMSGLSLNLADTGLLTSSFLYVYLLFQLPGGYLADHVRARYLLVFCSCPISLIVLLCFITGFACGGYMLVLGEVKKLHHCTPVAYCWQEPILVMQLVSLFALVMIARR